MIIDWYTIIFQIINFLVLVFLLRHFLYRPIIRTMDEREQKIVQREKDAALKKKEAEEQSQNYQRKKEELQEQEDEIKERAYQAAEKEKRALLDQARQEVDQTRQRWEEVFEREKESFITELRRRIGQQACSIARRCLEDLADSRLEELTWDMFIKKLSNLAGEEREALKKALAGSDFKFVLSSAFEPPDQKIEQLKSALQKEIAPKAKLSDFKGSLKTDRSLICGIELDTGSYHLAWSVDSYLEDLEAQILENLRTTDPAGQFKGNGENSKENDGGSDQEVSGGG